jgi:enoyl-CoA hydratase/carnithine racemase
MERKGMSTEQDNWVMVEERGNAGLITLNRPKALNALSLSMIRQLTKALLKWRDQASIKLVAIRGMGKGADGSFEPFGAFCAGGDIRFFHQAALAGDPALEDFFTEEYALNHLIHHYPKPYVAFMDGIVMGGGMGISQGASHRIVTERTKMAMPETGIGLFPDVGGGYFLSRCPGHVGEYLALTGRMITGEQSALCQLADVQMVSGELAGLWEAMPQVTDKASLDTLITSKSIAKKQDGMRAESIFSSELDSVFSLGSIAEMLRSLDAQTSDWAKETAHTLRHRSALMLHVVLEQIRRARSMSLADDLRMERDLVRHCFFTRHLGRSGAASETVEGIRALAVDKDHAPKWNPARIEDVTAEMVEPFFVSPWPLDAHPLAHLR